MLMRRFLYIFGLVCWTLSAQAPATIDVDQAIHEAIANNLELAASRYNISLAEARQITAKLRPNPVATISADHWICWALDTTRSTTLARTNSLTERISCSNVAANARLEWNWRQTRRRLRNWDFAMGSAG